MTEQEKTLTPLAQMACDEFWSPDLTKFPRDPLSPIDIPAAWEKSAHAVADHISRQLLERSETLERDAYEADKTFAMADDLLREKNAEIAKLQAFKDYVHKRLDDAGVERDPESTHKVEGCRIGGRLDLVFTEIARLKARVKQLKESQTCLACLKTKEMTCDCCDGF